jgi:hypothetical protein
MSSAPGDTSVVDTCTKKIMAALETDDVKVIGMSLYSLELVLWIKNS